MNEKWEYWAADIEEAIELYPDTKLFFKRRQIKRRGRCAVCNKKIDKDDFHFMLTSTSKELFYRLYDIECWDKIRELLPQELLEKIHGKTSVM